MLDETVISALLESPPADLAGKVAKTIGKGLVPAREVAVACGVTVQAINGWKNNGRVSKDHLKTLARLTGLPVSWWLPGDHDGDAPALSGSDWPFESIKLEDVAGLGVKARQQLEGAIALAVAQLKIGLEVSLPIAKQADGDILPIGTPANDEYAEVHRFDVKFAGGSGRISFFEDEKAKLAFRIDFLKSIGVKLKNAMIVYLQGDSHDPVIPSGSALLVDRGVTEMHTLENGGKGFFYAFWWAGGLAVKRLICQEDGAIMAYSCNPAPEFAPFQINKDTFKIIGRVKWMGTRL